MSETATVTDLQLLAHYTDDGAEDAFAEIVRRHLGLVYSAALRQVRSPQLAEEVAQSAFTDLARDAHRLARGGDAPSLGSLTPWLYTVTRRTAIDVIRREARRQLREQIATEMNALNETSPFAKCADASDWTHIEPLLDEAMSALDDTDRAAVLLRYFENKSLREVGTALGTSDDAAQKRVSRAVERLREFFAKQGITVGTSGFVAVISANAVQAAPVGLAVTISTAAALAGTTLTATTTTTAIKAAAMTTLQKTLATAALAAAVGTGIYETRKASTLEAQVQTLQQQQALLDAQLQKLREEKSDSASLGNKLVVTGSSSELLKLRAEVTRLRNEAKDAAAAGKDAMVFQAEVMQVLSNTPPVRTLVATATASVPWNDTVVLGGWKTPSGKRAIVMANVEHADDASNQVMITSRIIEYTEAAGINVGLSKFNTDESLPTRPSTLTAGQASELLKLAQGSDEVNLVSSPRVITRSGGQAQIQVVDMHSTPAGQKYSTGQVVDVVPTVSTDGQSVQLVMTAQLNYLIPFPPH